MSKPIVHVAFEPDIERETIDAALRVVLGHYGCLTCGLGGFDVALEASDPGDFALLEGERIVAVAELEQVHGAAVIGG